LVLANLLLLDLHLLKLASVGYLSMNLIGGFSLSSFKILSERVHWLSKSLYLPCQVLSSRFFLLIVR
jgi:hypothetical protein